MALQRSSLYVEERERLLLAIGGAFQRTHPGVPSVRDGSRETAAMLYSPQIPARPAVCFS